MSSEPNQTCRSKITTADEFFGTMPRINGESPSVDLCLGTRMSV